MNDQGLLARPFGTYTGLMAEAWTRWLSKIKALFAGRKAVVQQQRQPPQPSADESMADYNRRYWNKWSKIPRAPDGTMMGGPPDSDR